MKIRNEVHVKGNYEDYSFKIKAQSDKNIQLEGTGSRIFWWKRFLEANKILTVARTLCIHVAQVPSDKVQKAQESGTSCRVTRGTVSPGWCFPTPTRSLLHGNKAGAS